MQDTEHGSLIDLFMKQFSIYQTEVYTLFSAVKYHYIFQFMFIHFILMCSCFVQKQIVSHFFIHTVDQLEST